MSALSTARICNGIAYQLRMSVNNLSDTLASKGLLPEPPLDVVEDLSMRRVILVQDILELQISRPEAVAEMLGKNPTTVCNADR